MGKGISAWIVLTCCSLPLAASARTANDYAVAGRMHMRLGTTVGLREAREIFDAGIDDANCPDCRTDRALVFLRAVAKAATLFVDYNDILAGDDLLALAEGFGVTLAVDPFDDRDRDPHELIGPLPLPPERDPNQTRRVLVESVLPHLESIVAELDSIEDTPRPFVMVVPPEETGLAGDLEVDYGDVLIVKGLFLACKGVLGTRIASDSERYVYRGVSALPNSDEKASEENLLIEWARRLVVPPTHDEDTRSLAIVEQARQDWIDAITHYIDALEYIAMENCPPGADPQEDELTYIDPSVLPHLDVYTSVLTTLRHSLQRHMADSETIVATRTYEVRDSDTASVGRLVLVFDGARFEGRRGSLTLADGDVLEVDWFGLLDTDNVGISLFSRNGCVSGWLQGVIDTDRGAIADASLDFWGPDWQPEGGPVVAEPNGSGAQAGAASETCEVAISRLWTPDRLDDWFATTHLAD